MLYFDPGTEWAIIPARKALERLRAQSKELGLATMSKHLDMGSGVMVDLQVTEFQDRIRITGAPNSWFAMDPTQPLWKVASALLPATDPSAAPDATKATIPWNPVIQHITDTYLERPTTFVRTIGTEKFNVKVDQAQTIKHTLVICRFCERVATYTWDEVWTFDDTYNPPDVQQPEVSKATYKVTGSFKSFDTTNVTIQDLLGDGKSTPTNEQVIPHNLLADALANGHGWLAPGPDQPIMTPYTYSWGVTGPGTSAYQYEWTGAESWMINPDGSISGFTNYGTFSFVVFGPPNPWSIAVWPENPYLPGSTGTVVFGPGIPGYDQPAIQTAAAKAVSQAAYDAQVAALLAAAINLYQQIADLLSTKLTTDETELTTAPTVPYQDQKAAVIFPPSQTVVLTASYETYTQDFTATQDRDLLPLLGSIFGVSFQLSKAGTSPAYFNTFGTPVRYTFYPAGKAKTKTEAEIPAKSFALAPVDPKKPYLPYLKAYYSSGVDVTKLQSTTTAGIGWGAIYSAAGAPAKALYAGLLGIGDDTTKPKNRNPEALMQAMCAGAPVFDDVTYACYSAVLKNRGGVYRTTDHTYSIWLTDGSVGSVTQAAIPNDDPA